MTEINHNKLPPLVAVKLAMKDRESECKCAHQEDERIPGPEDDPTLGDLWMLHDQIELLHHEEEKRGQTEVAKALFKCAMKMMEDEKVHNLVSKHAILEEN